MALELVFVNVCRRCDSHIPPFWSSLSPPPRGGARTSPGGGALRCARALRVRCICGTCASMICWLLPIEVYTGQTSFLPESDLPSCCIAYWISSWLLRIFTCVIAGCCPSKCTWCVFVFCLQCWMYSLLSIPHWIMLVFWVYNLIYIICRVHSTHAVCLLFYLVWCCRQWTLHPSRWWVSKH